MEEQQLIWLPTLTRDNSICNNSLSLNEGFDRFDVININGLCDCEWSVWLSISTKLISELKTVINILLCTPFCHRDNQYGIQTVKVEVFHLLTVTMTKIGARNNG